MNFIDKIELNLKTAAIDEVDGKPNKFAAIQIRFGKKQVRSFSFNGDDSKKILMVRNLLEGENVRVTGQAVGTITED
ncbi:MAG: hypothetical protein WAV41_05535 [Microgenomates group bacterium]